MGEGGKGKWERGKVKGISKLVNEHSLIPHTPNREPHLFIEVEAVYIIQIVAHEYGRCEIGDAFCGRPLVFTR